MTIITTSCGDVLDISANSSEPGDLFIGINTRGTNTYSDNEACTGVDVDQLRAAIDEVFPPKPRPLTAEAIESVLHDILPLTANRLGEDDIASIASDLYLALTAPARDPRAEEMQADLATAEEPEMDDEDRRLIADHLTAMGYRKEQNR